MLFRSVEEQLTLQAPRYMQRRASIVRRHSVIDREFTLDYGLYRRLDTENIQNQAKTFVTIVLTTISLPVNAREYGILPFTCVPRGTLSRN